MPAEGTDCVLTETKIPLSVPAGRRWLAPLTSRIILTSARGQANQKLHSLDVALAELITYSQDGNHTRLKLIGGRILEVKESTDQIDRLARLAASQS